MSPPSQLFQKRVMASSLSLIKSKLCSPHNLMKPDFLPRLFKYFPGCHASSLSKCCERYIHVRNSHPAVCEHIYKYSVINVLTLLLINSLWMFRVHGENSCLQWITCYFESLLRFCHNSLTPISNLENLPPGSLLSIKCLVRRTPKSIKNNTRLTKTEM